MDQTELFRATVKAVRLRLRAQQKESGSVTSPDPAPSLLRSARKPTRFASEAKEVAGCITKLQQFLLQHRKAYVNSAGHLTSGISALTDSDRDQIDSDAQEFIKVCSERIQALQPEVAATDVGEQTRQYRQAVHLFLKDYLKRVCRLYSEQRAIRVKRIVERKRISRLQPEGYKRLLLSPKPTVPEVPTSSNDSSNHTPSDHTHATPRSHSPSASDTTSTSNDAGSTAGITDERTPDSWQRHEVSNASPALHQSPAGSYGWSQGRDFPSATPDHEDLSVEERREFELENEQLFEEVSTLVDEVRQIEGKVLEISKLQEIFTEKVLEQAKDLDIVSDLTVEASENVVEGNEQVREAIKNKASLRVWILFILIVCSFSLLFLDWYS